MFYRVFLLRLVTVGVCMLLASRVQLAHLSAGKAGLHQAPRWLFDASL